MYGAFLKYLSLGPWYTGWNATQLLISPHPAMFCTRVHDGEGAKDDCISNGETTEGGRGVTRRLAPCFCLFGCVTASRVEFGGSTFCSVETNMFFVTVCVFSCCGLFTSSLQLITVFTPPPGTGAGWMDSGLHVL